MMRDFPTTLWLNNYLNSDVPFLHMQSNPYYYEVSSGHLAFSSLPKMNSQDIIDLPDNYLILLYIKSSQEYRWMFHNTYINSINLFKQTFYILIFWGACI